MPSSTDKAREEELQLSRARRVAAFTRALFDKTKQERVLEEKAEDLGQRYLESTGAKEEQIAAAISGLKTALAGQVPSLDEVRSLEAIILRDECPTVDIHNDELVSLPKGRWKRLERDKGWLKDIIRAAGRVDCASIAAPYAGSGFLVANDIVMTNRHVALLFADGVGKGTDRIRSVYTSEVDYKREKRAPTDRAAVSVKEVLLIHPYWDVALLRVEPGADRKPIELACDAPPTLKDTEIAIVGYPFFQFIGSEYDDAVLLQNFGDTPGYKRLQPGRLTERIDYVPESQSFPRVLAVGHNASTLGGNSGSLVVDLNRKQVLGVHFAGQPFVTNWAVPTWEIFRDSRIRDLGLNFGASQSASPPPPDPAVEAAWEAADGRITSVVVPELPSGGAATTAAGAGSPPPAALRPPAPAPQPPGPSATPPSDALGAAVIRLDLPLEIAVRALPPRLTAPPPPAEPAAALVAGAALEAVNFDPDYESRTGYDPEFLDVEVPLPTLTDEGMKLVSRDRTRDDGDSHVLHYHHFSLVLNKRRRLAFFTAVNTTRDRRLAGQLTRKQLSKSEPWRLDPRVPSAHQITTKELYGPSPFDRGHLVRREDAYWGRTDEEAEWGNFDTYHYTNCSPQHPDYNQARNERNWGDLENHIEEQCRVKDLRMSVFAGPILTSRDPVLWDIRVPLSYWKIVAAVDAETGELGAWAFRLTQSKLVKTVREEGLFDPGKFGKLQVPLAKIEQLTEVRFPRVLHDADALGDRGAEESIALVTNTSMVLRRAPRKPA
jgi:endonuclease G